MDMDVQQFAVIKMDLSEFAWDTFGILDITYL